MFHRSTWDHLVRKALITPEFVEKHLKKRLNMGSGGLSNNSSIYSLKCLSMTRSIARVKKIKEDMMAMVWHPQGTMMRYFMDDDDV